jgi:hypothetical protein
MDEQEPKFNTGDIVTAEGKTKGRVYRRKFTTARALRGQKSKVRIAGQGTPQWFYWVRGGNFDDQQAWRQPSLKFAEG